MSLLDCQVGVLANQAMNFLASGQTPRRLGNAHPNIAPYQPFAAADGHLIIAVGNDGQFSKLCCELWLSALLDNGRVPTNADRVAPRGDRKRVCQGTRVSELANIGDGRK